MEKKSELRKITREELNDVLEKHKLWLDTVGEGERADLSYTDLRFSDLIFVNSAGADLSGANLSDAYLVGADLTGANLKGANLKGADLRDANLSYSNLSGADLQSADLYHADLRFADLQNTNLTDVKNFPNIPMACPTEGSFIGWKQADGYIIKLEIPEDAKRSSGTSTKCRCNKAKVLSIENKNGTPADVTEVCSCFDKNFIYRVGETVTVDDFDDNRFNECAPGIHFYMDRYNVAFFLRVLRPLKSK